MTFTKGLQLLAVTYCNAVIVTENQLLFIIGRQRLTSVYEFRVHVY